MILCTVKFLWDTVFSYLPIVMALFVWGIVVECCKIGSLWLTWQFVIVNVNNWVFRGSGLSAVFVIAFARFWIFLYMVWNRTYSCILEHIYITLCGHFKVYLLAVNITDCLTSYEFVHKIQFASCCEKTQKPMLFCSARRLAVSS